MSLRSAVLAPKSLVSSEKCLPQSHGFVYMVLWASHAYGLLPGLGICTTAGCGAWARYISKPSPKHAMLTVSEVGVQVKSGISQMAWEVNTFAFQKQTKVLLFQAIN